MSSEKEEEVVITLEDKTPNKKKKGSSLTSFFSGIVLWKILKKLDNVNKTVKKWTLQTETVEKWRFVDYHNSIIAGWKMVVFVYNFQPL